MPKPKAAPKRQGLADYKRKRDFTKTPEPEARVAKARGPLRFVVQKHRATALHYDFRLEAGGTLRSWAVPTGPPLHPKHRPLPLHAAHHPLDPASSSPS